jgi:hypothetical protein
MRKLQMSSFFGISSSSRLVDTFYQDWHLIQVGLDDILHAYMIYKHKDHCKRSGAISLNKWSTYMDVAKKVISLLDSKNAAWWQCNRSPVLLGACGFVIVLSHATCHLPFSILAFLHSCIRPFTFAEMWMDIERNGGEDKGKGWRGWAGPIICNHIMHENKIETPPPWFWQERKKLCLYTSQGPLMTWKR